MKYYEDLTEYRHGLQPSLWTASGPPAPCPGGLYSWLWDHPTPEPAFGDPEKNIGWLDAHHDYPRGPSDPDFSAILEIMCRETRYHLWKGNYPCLLCAKVLSGRLGAAEIRVQGEGIVYAAPNLVHHHITSHGYAPPRGFIEAVLASNGRQAEPVPGTTRGVPAELLTRDRVDVEVLQRHVVDLLRSRDEAEEIPNVFISLDGDHFVVEATFAPLGPAEGGVRRTWNVPQDAVLNLEQASFGIRSMLSHALNLWKQEHFREGKEPFSPE